jgi:GNAT superfamily N-acetyltransferase
MPDSNLVVSLLTPDEAPQWMRIRHAAFVNDMNKIFYFNAPASEKTLERVVQEIRDNIKKGVIYTKCVDASTNEMIAGGRWTYNRPSDPTATLRTPEELDEQFEIKEPYDEGHLEIWNEIFSMLNVNKREIMGLRPYYSLDTLVTHPDYYRRGAGALLLKEGLERVDKAGVESYLEASMMGKPLYARWGYEPVKNIALDLRRWGGDDLIEWTVS